jgi:hypothetical protein
MNFELVQVFDELLRVFVRLNKTSSQLSLTLMALLFPVFENSCKQSLAGSSTLMLSHQLSLTLSWFKFFMKVDESFCSFKQNIQSTLINSHVILVPSV